MSIEFHLSAAARPVLLTAAVVGTFAFTADPALADHVSCGDTITADTTLDSDLVDCPNNGIVIGADDITLDLNGHRIDGDGTEFQDALRTEPCDLGIANDGHDGVTVSDGSVREFATGVLVGSARQNRVLEHLLVENTTSSGSCLAASARSLVRDSSGSHNIAPEGDGFGLFGSDHIRILNNEIRRNPGPGIHVFDSHDNLIKGNLFFAQRDPESSWRGTAIRCEATAVFGTAPASSSPPATET